MGKKIFAYPHRTKKMAKVKRNFQVGDVVLVATDNTPREKWPLGRITEIFPDEKGHVRSVMLISKNNKYKRPIANWFFSFHTKKL